MRKRDARVAFFWLAVFVILFYKDKRNYPAAKSLCSAVLILETNLGPPSRHGPFKVPSPVQKLMVLNDLRRCDGRTHY
jgi:hypothetical protein